MKKISVSIRWYIIWFVLLVVFVTIFSAGPITYLLRRRLITRIATERVELLSQDLASRSEVLLSGVEQLMFPLLEDSLLVDRQDFEQILQVAMNTSTYIRALYFIDEHGLTFAVGNRDPRGPMNEDVIGIDFSRNPLYQNVSRDNEPVWSDKFISAFSGDASIGVAIRKNGYTVIAELSLETLLDVVETAIDANVRIWVVDRRRELVIETGEQSRAGIRNVGNEEIVKLAFANAELPTVLTWTDGKYYSAYAHSEKLGWVFLVGDVSGIDNVLVQNAFLDASRMGLMYFFISVLLALIWSRVFSKMVHQLKLQSQRIAEGHSPVQLDSAFIREVQELDSNLKVMGKQVVEREAALHQLNEELEERVDQRTVELVEINKRLQQSLDDVHKMQDMVIRSEKLAALGRMVAGIAHELNTPIGNSLMAVTAVRADLSSQEKIHSEANGLISMEESLVDEARLGLDIAERNIHKAAELVRSFKQISADQVGARRRSFLLSEVIEDVLITLRPSIKKSPHKVLSDISQDVPMDSHPGVLAQVLTNLISNSLVHAFSDGQQGNVLVRAEMPTDDMVRISVADDGKGIDPEIRNKVFDPFFTTRVGAEGTGLGLNLAVNQVERNLGGTIDFLCPDSGGTEFFFVIPRVAPD